MELLKSPLTFYILWLYQHLKVRRFCQLDYMARVENCWLEGQNHVYRDAVVKDSKIGLHTYIGRGCHIQNAVIGRYCSIAPGVTIGGGIHPTDQRSTHPSQYEPGTVEGRQVEIGSDVWIGQSAILLDGVKVGNGAVIGAGCVVTRNVRPFSIVAGNPMRTLRKRPVQDESWYY